MRSVNPYCRHRAAISATIRSGEKPYQPRLYTAGSALLGLSVGMVVRHSAGTVSGLLVWWLVVEGMVVSFAPVQVVRFVPFDAGARTLGIETDMDRPEVVAAGLANALHASIFWGYVIASLVLGAVVLVRLDAD